MRLSILGMSIFDHALDILSRHKIYTTGLALVLLASQAAAGQTHHHHRYHHHHPQSGYGGGHHKHHGSRNFGWHVLSSRHGGRFLRHSRGHVDINATLATKPIVDPATTPEIKLSPEIAAKQLVGLRYGMGQGSRIVEGTVLPKKGQRIDCSRHFAKMCVDQFGKQMGVLAKCDSLSQPRKLHEMLNRFYQTPVSYYPTLKALLANRGIPTYGGIAFQYPGRWGKHIISIMPSAIAESCSKLGGVIRNEAPEKYLPPYLRRLRAFNFRVVDTADAVRSISLGIKPSADPLKPPPRDLRRAPSPQVDTIIKDGPIPANAVVPPLTPRRAAMQPVPKMAQPSMKEKLIENMDKIRAMFSHVIL